MRKAASRRSGRLDAWSWFVLAPTGKAKLCLCFDLGSASETFFLQGRQLEYADGGTPGFRLPLNLCEGASGTCRGRLDKWSGGAPSLPIAQYLQADSTRENLV